MFEPTFLGSTNFTSNLRILELGSGTGIIAAELAKHLSARGGIIIATDLPEVCSLLEQNLPSHSTNTHSPPSMPLILICPLTWGNHDHVQHLRDNLANLSHDTHLTHIICSDLVSHEQPKATFLTPGLIYDRSSYCQVYFPELFGPLLRSLIHLTSPPFSNNHDLEVRPKLIISYKVRSLSKETPFWSAFGLWFHFEPVLYSAKSSTLRESHDVINYAGISDLNDRLPSAGSDHREEGGFRIFGTSADNDSPTFIFVGHRRPESAFWQVPDNDEELISGIGALGTQTRKSDDTFESILFLNLGVED